MRYKEIMLELSGVKQHLSVLSNPKNISDYMRKFGYKEIGSGEYSYVFARNGTDMALKIYNDSNYDRFISLCKQNPDNKFLPKFRGNPSRLNDQAKMIRIERLSPMTLDEYRTLRIDRLVKIAKGGFDQAWTISDLTNEQLDLLGTIRQIVGNAGPDIFIDLFVNNFMKRGETPVIIDPYAGKFEGGWGSLPDNVDESVLTELQGIKSLKPDQRYFDPSDEEISEILSRFGFQHLGSGLFGSVYAYNTNPNLVVKVYDDSNNGYRRFLQYCEKNKFNPCLPQFKGKSIKVKGDMRMIRMEKLLPISSDEYRKKLKFAIQSIKDGENSYSEDDPNFDFFETIRDLNQTGFYLDLHYENIMKRPSGEFVITDPFSE